MTPRFPGAPLALLWFSLPCAAAIIQGAPQAVPTYAEGREVVPAYEGWERNADGTFDLVFGYMNRNFDRAVEILIGPGNGIQPGGPDRGQPTHFLPRRNFFLFRVRVPADFGDRELVWTITSNGKTERAYGTLRSGYRLDKNVMAATLGAVGPGTTTKEVSDRNTAPALAVEGAANLSARVNVPISIAAVARDDEFPPRIGLPPWLGSPAASAAGALLSPAGLRLAWFVYRGNGEAVTFDPPQFKVYVDFRGGSPWSPGWTVPPAPPDGRWLTRATFSAPGTYVLRCLAHDGAAATHADVTVVVQ